MSESSATEGAEASTSASPPTPSAKQGHIRLALLATIAAASVVIAGLLGFLVYERLQPSAHDYGVEVGEEAGKSRADDDTEEIGPLGGLSMCLMSEGYEPKSDELAYVGPGDEDEFLDGCKKGLKNVLGDRYVTDAEDFLTN